LAKPIACSALSALTFHDPVALTVDFSDEKRETRNFIGGSLGLGVSVRRFHEDTGSSLRSKGQPQIGGVKLGCSSNRSDR